MRLASICCHKLLAAAPLSAFQGRSCPDRPPQAAIQFCSEATPSPNTASFWPLFFSSHASEPACTSHPIPSQPWSTEYSRELGLHPMAIYCSCMGRYRHPPPPQPSCALQPPHFGTGVAGMLPQRLPTHSRSFPFWSRSGWRIPAIPASLSSFGYHYSGHVINPAPLHFQPLPSCTF